jgi:hypothetical protein
MDYMSFVIDYALIDPMTLAYRVDHVAPDMAFATYEDIDEDCFRLNVFPQGKVIPNKAVLAIAEVVRDYLFDE